MVDGSQAPGEVVTYGQQARLDRFRALIDQLTVLSGLGC